MAAAGRAGAPSPREKGELATARAEIDAADRALGDRWPIWWTDRAVDLNRQMTANTPYAEGFAGLDTPASAGARSRCRPVG